MRVERDGTYVAIASYGGGPKHPVWYHNFLAHPEVDLQDGPVKKSYRARLVEGDERAEWWQFAVETWPTYGEYQKRTEREIPVFLLEPLD
jgi:F420H(2)-dependent quinone reductase